jgi:hypothetical protein
MPRGQQQAVGAWWLGRCLGCVQYTSLHFTYMARVNRAPTEGANRLMGQNQYTALTNCSYGMCVLQGSATYAPEKSALVWHMRNFPGGKEYMLR